LRFAYTIVILSSFLNEGRLVRQSFAYWLAPYILQEVLYLDVIACCTWSKFCEFLRVQDPVAVAWRNSTDIDDDWAGRLAAASGLSKTTVYQRQEKWRGELLVDIKIPYPYYRDLFFYGPNSVYSPEDRTAHNEAVEHNRDEDAMRLRRSAIKNFQGGRIGVLGAAIQSSPILPVTRPTPAQLESPDKLGLDLIDTDLDEDIIDIPAKPQQVPPVPAKAGKGPRRPEAFAAGSQTASSLAPGQAPSKAGKGSQGFQRAGLNAPSSTPLRSPSAPARSSKGGKGPRPSESYGSSGLQPSSSAPRQFPAKGGKGRNPPWPGRR